MGFNSGFSSKDGVDDVSVYITLFGEGEFHIMNYLYLNEKEVNCKKLIDMIDNVVF